jgi:hypothetical protein
MSCLKNWKQQTGGRNGKNEMRIAIEFGAAIWLFVFVIGCETENAETKLAPQANAVEQQVATGNPASLSYDDYYNTILERLALIEIPAAATAAEDNSSFIDSIDVPQFAEKYAGENLDSFFPAIDERKIEYRWKDDHVIRIRKDKQSFRVFLADRQFTIEKDAYKPVLPADEGIALARAMTVELGLPDTQLGQPITDTITYSVDDTELRVEEDFEGERGVWFPRTVGGFEVMGSKAFFLFSKDGELVSSRVNWPAFKLDTGMGSQARSKEEMAVELAAETSRLLEGAGVRFSGEPVVVWKPARLGNETTYKLFVQLVVMRDSDDWEGDPPMDIYATVF